MLAVGIVGNVENIGLERHQGAVERTTSWSTNGCATGEPGVYAIGDVVGPPWLAHKAMHEGVICVEHIAGLNTVASARLDEHAGLHLLPAAGGERRPDREAGEGRRAARCKVGRFPFIGNGKAIALGEPEGMVKTVFDAKTGELLGAHMIGAEVTELIQGYAIATTLETHRAGADADHLPASRRCRR